ncbi:MAG: YvcK family protein [Chloroflexi bacterium]|nr:YvcK family protein [Chloroflexota bacterium]
MGSDDSRLREHAKAAQRPRIVALGGGHGLSTLLRGLKHQPCDLTAIVTVADDGGSSGVLRRETGMLPPGDLRRCIAALAEAEPLMSQLFEYRFGRGAGLDGHAFGNLFIAAMAGIMGDFERGLGEASRVLKVKGRVFPASLENVALCAEVCLPDGETRLVVQGQSQIAKAGGIVERVYLQPNEPKAYPAAIGALLSADMILLGPGSLYTSVLPNMLVPDILHAIRASTAFKVYVCNVATQPGETTGYTAGDHVWALAEHMGGKFGECVDCVLANGNTAFSWHSTVASTMVLPTLESGIGRPDQPECTLILEDLVDRALPWRHDADRLAEALMRLWRERAGTCPDMAVAQDRLP